MPRSFACVLSLMGLFGGASTIAEEPPSTPGAMSLFDGETLEGWQKTPFYGADDVEIRAAEGVLHLARGKTLSGVTSTRTDLPNVNYELSYEARRTDGVDFFAAATFPIREGFLTFVNGGWGGNITGLSCLDGADASENETTTGFRYKDEVWYRFRIHVTADAVRCWIDDKPVVAVDVQDRGLTTRIQVRSSQPLGFASYESTGEVRNITIRPLTTDEVAENRVDSP